MFACLTLEEQLLDSLKKLSKNRVDKKTFKATTGAWLP